MTLANRPIIAKGATIGPYTLLDKIGQGQFGSVWLAERRTTIANTLVALKLPLVDEVNLESVKEEARAWARATGHPNVVPIFEAAVHGRYVVIASEYVAGGDLTAWLKSHSGRAPSLAVAGQMMDGILAGLSHLHRVGIIHRDLKPANILLQDGIPRIADFGVSRIRHPDYRWSDIAGTPAYMAPEAFDGFKDDQTDLWSVGIILYEILMGGLPFASVHEIRNKDCPPIPTTVPLSVRRVIQQVLQRDRAARYPSAVAMRLDLKRALTEQPEEAHLAVPAYFYPGPEWSQMLNGAPRVAMAIMNPNSGPSGEVNRDYVEVREAARKKGVRVLGYVATSYGAKPFDEVHEEIDKYKVWYSVDGIFVDQVPTDLASIDYYRGVVSHIRSRPGGLTILNPGTFPDEEYAKLTDVLCVFDGSNSDHSIRRLPEWIFGYPASKFWHIVYDAPTSEAMKRAVSSAKRNNAGYFFVTDGQLPNPFGRLPSYWLEELS
jgi:Protein kinase domain/Spherulation-specific family 4